MGAKSLCIPFEQPTGEHALVPGKTKCTQCGLDAKVCLIPWFWSVSLWCSRDIDYLAIALHALWKILLVVLFRPGISLGKTVWGLFVAWWDVGVFLLFLSSFRILARLQCIPETQFGHHMPKHYIHR